MNKVILVGRLTKDPEIKRTSNDIPVVQFTLAVNRIYQNKNGEKQADFINCVVWRQQAENLARYMRKGSQIGVEGQIQVRTYDDPNGQRRYITEVICDNIHFLESKKDSGYSDVNKYEIPESRNSYSDYKSKDPFQAISESSGYSYESNDEKTQDSNDVEDPFANLKTSSSISDDDLPF